ncbi:glycosyltransferase family 2 protein [Patescibacteria group bacterium]|nr:glycosyltransferase family 2 protein [Patescibacteria group bacterium]
MITLTYILSFLAFFLLILNFSASIYTIFYFKYLYPQKIRPKFDPDYQPTCTIIIPVKGIPHQFNQNIHALLNQNYPDYNIIFTVENQQDPAYNLIKPYQSKYPRIKLVTSQLSSTCCQKNQNLISAVRHSPNSEVLVFADDDVINGQNWLSELILPLSNPKITATSTFFWPISHQDNFGELSFVFANIYTLSLYCFSSSFFKFPLLWGGSIAIKQKTFNELKVKKYWSTNVVDDTSLSKLLSDNRHRTTFVPTAMGLNTKPINNTFSFINWYIRQLMYLKLYHKRMWYIISNTMFWTYILIYSLVPLLIIIYIFDNRHEFLLLTFIPITLFLFEAINSLLYNSLGKINHPIKLIILTPLLRVTQVIAYLKTLFCRNFLWANTTYHFDSTGRVTNIIRK